MSEQEGYCQLLLIDEYVMDKMELMAEEVAEEVAFKCRELFWPSK